MQSMAALGCWAALSSAQQNQAEGNEHSLIDAVASQLFDAITPLQQNKAVAPQLNFVRGQTKGWKLSDSDVQHHTEEEKKRLKRQRSDLRCREFGNMWEKVKAKNRELSQENHGQEPDIVHVIEGDFAKAGSFASWLTEGVPQEQRKILIFVKDDNTPPIHFWSSLVPKKIGEDFQGSWENIIWVDITKSNSNPTRTFWNKSGQKIEQVPAGRAYKAFGLEKSWLFPKEEYEGIVKPALKKADVRKDAPNQLKKGAFTELVMELVMRRFQTEQRLENVENVHPLATQVYLGGGDIAFVQNKLGKRKRNVAVLEVEEKPEDLLKRSVISDGTVANIPKEDKVLNSTSLTGGPE